MTLSAQRIVWRATCSLRHPGSRGVHRRPGSCRSLPRERAGRVRLVPRAPTGFETGTLHQRRIRLSRGGPPTTSFVMRQGFVTWECPPTTLAAHELFFCDICSTTSGLARIRRGLRSPRENGSQSQGFPVGKRPHGGRLLRCATAAQGRRRCNPGGECCTEEAKCGGKPPGCFCASPSVPAPKKMKTPPTPPQKSARRAN